jgi:hypothetical protein
MPVMILNILIRNDFKFQLSKEIEEVVHLILPLAGYVWTWISYGRKIMLLHAVENLDR